MNILIVIDRLAIGGAELLMVNVARRLVKNGVVPVFCGLGEDGQLVDILRQNQFNYFSCDAGSGVRLGIMSQLFKLIKTHKIDLVLTNHFRQLVHSFLPALISRTPIIHIEHDLQNYLHSRKNYRRLVLMSRKASAVVAISNNLGQWFASQSPPLRCPLQVIANGIDTSLFFPVSEEQKRQRLLQHFPGLQGRPFILGTCARLEAIKNIEFMIEVFATFHQNHPEAMLIIIGDGSRRRQLEEQASARGLSRHVIFIGLIEDVHQWVQLFDLYLLTSFDEGLPLSVLEAMSCDVPVAANNVGELPGLITGRTGRLMTTLDAEQWADILEEYYRKAMNSELPPQTGGHALVQEKYSLDRCAGRYLHLMQKAVAS